MKIAMMGRGGDSGSWKIRGEQLGAAMGAEILPDTITADVIVGVKRLSPDVLCKIRASRKPWAWDIVDAYPQPLCSGWNRQEALIWARHEIRRLNPTAVIWPTRRMGEEVGFKGPSLVLPHHHRPNIQRNPIRPQIRKIGYEGAAVYIESHLPAIQAECEKRGAEFVINPAHLADVDVVLALRGGQWDGYVQRHWKSGVKMSNAHGSGTPFIGARECGYQESACGAEYWADSEAELSMSLDWLESQSAREQVSDRFVQAAFSVDQAAAQLSEFLHGL